MRLRWWQNRNDARTAEARAALAAADRDFEEATTLRTEATVRRMEAGSLADRLRIIRLNNHITPSLFPPERNPPCP